MSRGPGALQRRVLETLATYQRLGPALQWQWHVGHRYSPGNYATDGDIRDYEAGRYVPVWILLRDLSCTRAELSRTLKSLERQDLVCRYDGSLTFIRDPYRCGRNTKFVRIMPEGEAWLKRQQINSAKVGTYLGVEKIALASPRLS